MPRAPLSRAQRVREPDRVGAYTPCDGEGGNEGRARRSSVCGPRAKSTDSPSRAAFSRRRLLPPRLNFLIRKGDGEREAPQLPQTSGLLSPASAGFWAPAGRPHPVMKSTANVVVETDEGALLVPYRPEHVPVYHGWWKLDALLQEQTGTEPAGSEEEELRRQQGARGPRRR